MFKQHWKDFKMATQSINFSSWNQILLSWKETFYCRSILPTRMVNFSFSYISCFCIYVIFITVDNSRLYTLQCLLSKQFAHRKRKNHKALLCESDLFLLQKHCVPKWIACLLVLSFFFKSRITKQIIPLQWNILFT